MVTLLLVKIRKFNGRIYPAWAMLIPLSFYIIPLLQRRYTSWKAHFFEGSRGCSKNSRVLKTAKEPVVRGNPNVGAMPSRQTEELKKLLFLLTEAEKLQRSGVNLKYETTDATPNDLQKRANFLLD
jgi:hypothetical protein